MKYSAKYEENLKRLRDCTQHKHIDRIPHFSNFFTWKMLDSDLHPKLSEALSDYGMLDRIQCEFHERYHFDTYYDLNCRNLLKPSAVLGSGTHHVINDEMESINFIDHVLMEGDEYEEYRDNRTSVNWKMWTRKCPDLTREGMARSMVLQMENTAFTAYMKQKFAEEYDIPYAYGPVNIQVPFERFNKYYRGIKEAHLDLRRKKALLKDVFDKIQQDEVMPNLKNNLKNDTSHFMNDAMAAMLSHTMLSEKQWEEMFWPYMKMQLDEVLSVGKTVLLYLENSILRFKDYFLDYPKGFITIVPEMDDVIDIRKEMPNLGIAGGMNVSMLQDGTEQDCIDRVKYLADELGDGFMLGQNKMVSFRRDCKRENLLAVCDYLQNFRW